MSETLYDVIIIGSGPAGLTAAIYTTRANLKTLVVAGRLWGGQLMLTTLVENYPGFPEGIMGPDLMKLMRKQAEYHGAEMLDVNFRNADFTHSSLRSFRMISSQDESSGLQPEASAERQARSVSADGSEQGKTPFVLTADDGKTYQSKSIIITTGADTKWLDVAGEKERIGRGVSSCAPCDAPFYKGKKVIVVGGGDSAMEEALVLTKFADHIWIVHRKDSFRASDIMQERAFENPKITVVWNTEVVEVAGEGKVERVKLRSNINPSASVRLRSLRALRARDQNFPLRQDFAGQAKLQLKVQNQDKEMTPEEIGGKLLTNNELTNNPSTSLRTSGQELTWQFPIDGVFVAIGHIPNTQLFKGLEVDEKGFIKVYNHTKTNIEGVFVGGDVHDALYKQAVTAAGFGCMAALEAERWLEDQKT